MEFVEEYAVAHEHVAAFMCACFYKGWVMLRVKLLCYDGFDERSPSMRGEENEGALGATPTFFAVLKFSTTWEAVLRLLADSSEAADLRVLKSGVCELSSGEIEL